MLEKYPLGLEAILWISVEKFLCMTLFEYEFERIKVMHYDLMIDNDKDGAPCTISFNFTTHVASQVTKGLSYRGLEFSNNSQRDKENVTSMFQEYPSSLHPIMFS